MKCFEFKMLYSSCVGYCTVSSTFSFSSFCCCSLVPHWFSRLEKNDSKLLPCNARVGKQTHLSSGIDDLGRKFLVLKLDDLGEGVLDGGIVALDKVPVDELDREGGFAWRSAHTHIVLVYRAWKIRDIASWATLSRRLTD